MLAEPQEVAKRIQREPTEQDGGIRGLRRAWATGTPQKRLGPHRRKLLLNQLHLSFCTTPPRPLWAVGPQPRAIMRGTPWAFAALRMRRGRCIPCILLHYASASSAVRRTLATTGYAADDMDLRGPPHGVEMPPLRPPTLQHACQFVERPGWPDHDAISDQLEDQHRSGIHLQVFTHTSWNHHLTARSNSRLRDHAPLTRPSPPPRGYPGARVPQADREAQSRDRRNSTAAPTRVIGAAVGVCVNAGVTTYLQYFLNRSLIRPQCRPARQLSMYLARAGPSLW